MAVLSYTDGHNIQRQPLKAADHLDIDIPELSALGSNKTYSEIVPKSASLKVTPWEGWLRPVDTDQACAPSVKAPKRAALGLALDLSINKL